MPGGRFGPYELHELLGRGGMGEVHRAYDTRRGRFVALKRLLAVHALDDEFRLRFLRECHGAARLNEAHVVPIHDFGDIDGTLYLDMRLIDGHDLAGVLAAHGPLPAAAAVDVVSQVAAALDAAHATGLVHRDVKPSNVLVDGTGPTPHCYLVDFGVAATTGPGTGSSPTRSGVVAGTLEYVAPERLRRGPTDHRVDVYSLACLLHELLTGRPPFEGHDIAALCTAHLFQEPPRPSGAGTHVPAALDDVVVRGMAKDPAARYPSAGALAAAARAALGPVTGSGRGDGPVTANTVLSPHPVAARGPSRATGARASAPGRPRSAPARRRRSPLSRRLVLLGALLTAAVLGGLVMALLRSPGQAAVAEGAASVGRDPFMPSSAGGPGTPTTTAATTAPQADSAAGPSPAGNGPVRGDTAGLYGGTRTNACDPHALVAFLGRHPDRARAWADAEHIGPADIAAFVASLTPVVLRTDVAVTNNGFASGHAQPFGAVLQAGTAVLVDATGIPRARCACGNPLGRPSAGVSLDLAGTPWPGYRQDHVVAVEPSASPVTRFVLVAVDAAPGTAPVVTRPVGTTTDAAADAEQTQQALQFGTSGSATAGTNNTSAPETSATSSTSSTSSPDDAGPVSSSSAGTSTTSGSPGPSANAAAAPPTTGSGSPATGGSTPPSASPSASPSTAPTTTAPATTTPPVTTPPVTTPPVTTPPASTGATTTDQAGPDAAALSSAPAS